VLSPFAAQEPIIALKITGPGQRATLSALVEEGRRAVTIRVNDVLGVGGFVLAGDRVDVLLTRTEGQNQGGTTDVILQGVRVLAVDQLADDRTDRPSSQVRSVTIEVSIQDAQRVQLASVAGTLSLILRRSGEANAGTTRRITLDDVVGNAPQAPAAPAATQAAGNFALSSLFERRQPTQGVVTVFRPKEKQEYTVPLEQRR
jgi:pilus assembly protein CpaB